MSTTRIAVLGLAIGSAVLAAYLAKGFIGAKPKTEVVEVSTVPTSDVLVAVKDVQMGDKLTPSHVGWQSWPEKSITPMMITKVEDPDALATMGASRARVAIFEGEPIMEKKVVLPNQNGFMSAILPKGMRAISVRISEETGAGGFILPNDRVDVILTRKRDENGVSIAESETVLSDVRVLAIDQTFRQDEETNQVVVAKRTATLELNLHQAEVVSMAETSGQLSLALRSIAENDGKALADVGPTLADKYANSQSGSADLTIVKYGISKRYTNHQ